MKTTNLIWLAGLAGISQEMREAARIDGAGGWRLFWHIDLPQLRGTAVFVAALSSINAFQTFTLQYVTTSDPGGSANSTLVLGLLVLKYGFQSFRMGDATAVVFAFPIWFMVSSAFKPEEEVMAIPVHWWPERFQGLGRFVEAAEFAPLWRYFGNSMLFSLVHVAATVIFGALAGFGFAKYRFPGRGFLFFFVICTLMIPFQILVVPLFIEVKAFGWENSYPGLIIPGMMNAFGVFMLRQYAQDLPDELLEAGRVDGAGEFHMFVRLVLPLLGPALASLAIIVFIWSWGAFLWPLVIIQDREMNVLAVGLTNYSQPYQHAPMWGAAMAASTIATVPIAALFVFFQRYFVKGLTAAAVKG